ncbi:MAG: dihydropyrimidine dehydrogenase, partial [Candidatus Aminicenantes bacterium]|nr:dihydropyrimidine dehydrogenase [Candidatus Aminicenantes bacterium]
MTENKKTLSPEQKEELKIGFNLEWRKELRKAIPMKERMKIERQKMPERDPNVRNKDFFEVNCGLDAEAAVKEAQRCWDCATPQCIVGCPVGIDIPGF